MKRVRIPGMVRPGRPSFVEAWIGVLCLAMLLFLALATACGGGKGSWQADDTRKATEIDFAVTSLLTLCQVDSGMDSGAASTPTCDPRHVRALASVAQCKVSSLLYAHGEEIPEDAGGGCVRELVPGAGK